MPRTTMVVPLARACVLAAAAALAGCTSAPAPTGPVRYPPTGNTVTVELRVQDVEWAVGPDAIYDAWTYNGTIPGPTIEATAGDRIVVTLVNESDHPASVHTHLVEFEQIQDGADPASIAEPGETVTYEWFAPYAGAVPYHDHADEGEGVARGLVGALVIHAPDEVHATEHVVVLSDLESRNFLRLPGVADPVTGMIAPGEYRGAHQYRHIMNGHAYEDAIPPFSARIGDLSRWRVISIGIQAHTFHIHGHRWVDADGTLTDNIQLAPGTYRTFEFEEDREGDWLVHCHFPEHMEGGMMTRYRVTP